MPSGIYVHLDPEGPPGAGPSAFERFSCATGPVGWRYVSTLTSPAGSALGRVDVTVDAHWRQLRVEVSRGGWLVRGGSTGAGLAWVRAPDGGTTAGADRVEDAVEQSATAGGFFGRSPGLVVPAVRLLGLAPRARVRLAAVLLTEPVLASRLQDQGWTLLGTTRHDTDAGVLLVERYEEADLATGRLSEWHLAGDVVLAGPDLELTELTGAPSAVPVGT
ncbi:MAG: hypothetical protein M3Z02_10830 [Actinomycetota bacterium]|nr:hypothetical protein [Actinomycetota bacterium]